MHVTIPEPFNPVQLLAVTKPNLFQEKLDTKELICELQRAKARLEEICKRDLCSQEYCVVDYSLYARNFADHYIEFLCGGFDLTVRGGKEFSLPRFYLESQKLMESVITHVQNNQPLYDLEFRVTGFRDVVHEELNIE